MSSLMTRLTRDNDIATGPTASDWKRPGVLVRLLGWWRAWPSGPRTPSAPMIPEEIRIVQSAGRCMEHVRR